MFTIANGQSVLGGYMNSLLVLASLSAVIVLGQGDVILCGGLDLSILWMTTMAGVQARRHERGVRLALHWSLPTVLLEPGVRFNTLSPSQIA